MLKRCAVGLNQYRLNQRDRGGDSGFKIRDFMLDTFAHTAAASRHRREYITLRHALA